MWNGGTFGRKIFLCSLCVNFLYFVLNKSWFLFQWDLFESDKFGGGILEGSVLAGELKYLLKFELKKLTRDRRLIPPPIFWENRGGERGVNRPLLFNFFLYLKKISVCGGLGIYTKYILLFFCRNFCFKFLICKIFCM